jgi:hypothetical protein
MYKANLIFQKLKEQMAVPENYEVSRKLAKHMVLNKYRAKGHIQILQRYVPLNSDNIIYKSFHCVYCSATTLLSACAKNKQLEKILATDLSYPSPR